MAFYDTTWYCNSTAYAAIAQRASGAVVAAGAIRRQFTAPAVGNERCFICVIAGTTAVATDATWILTRGAKTVDGTVTWQECTGQASLNGDATNVLTWAQAKAIGGIPSLGVIVKRNNGASYQIMSTAGTFGTSEPLFSDTAGVTANDFTGQWTSLGPVGSFTGGMAPFARLAATFTANWFAAGNTIYVGGNHAESQTTAISISPSITSGMNKVICHNESGSYPPTASDLRTTAVILTNAAVNITLAPAGASFYFYGLTFRAGVGQTGAASVIITPGVASWLSMENCSFQVATTSVVSQVVLGASYNHLFLNNVTVSFAHTSQNVRFGNSTSIGLLLWQNTAPILAVGSVAPTKFFKWEGNNAIHQIILEALDLSQMTNELFDLGGLVNTVNVTVRDCKLSASAIVTPLASWGQVVQFIRSSA